MSSAETQTATVDNSSTDLQVKDSSIAPELDAEMPSIDNVSSKTSEAVENQGSSSPQVSKKPKTELRGLPTRQYLDQTVVPILLEGLAALARERPSDPIEYLISYLEKHKSEHQ